MWWFRIWLAQSTMRIYIPVKAPHRRWRRYHVATLEQYSVARLNGPLGHQRLAVVLAAAARPQSTAVQRVQRNVRQCQPSRNGRKCRRTEPRDALILSHRVGTNIDAQLRRSIRSYDFVAVLFKKKAHIFIYWIIWQNYPFQLYISASYRLV